MLISSEVDLILNEEKYIYIYLLKWLYDRGSLPLLVGVHPFPPKVESNLINPFSVYTHAECRN